MREKKSFLVALAGQQNSGKTTTYNMLTGANQHVANYPGVTVEKHSGYYRKQEIDYTVVDLPGTYSLTSFSLEERVSRDFLLEEHPDLVVNVIDGTTLRRSLYLTFQLLEMGLPVILTVNMMDVAKRQGMRIDIPALSRQLGIDVVATVSRQRQGKEALKDAIYRGAASVQKDVSQKVDYQHLEKDIAALLLQLEKDAAFVSCYPLRWLAIKLMENDAEAVHIVKEKHAAGKGIVREADERRERFEQIYGLRTEDFIASCRDQCAGEIEAACLVKEERRGDSLSERLDRVLLYRPLAPFFLLGTVCLIYNLSIIQGYKLTPYLWNWLAKFKIMAADILPAKGMLEDSLLTSLGLWMVDSVNALLIYLPIFAILFSLIALLEDSGYMARIAFILDRILHSFGLHGQSTLPFVLGGVFASGCAVPGIMATRGIPDERSRLATILTVPYMNCMAKIPLYTLLVTIYFKGNESIAMFFIATVTIIMAMIIAKFLTVTILHNKETSPFIMEMPNYHLPTLFGIIRRTAERLWEYIKKVGTIVLAVSVCVFALLHFPGLDADKFGEYQTQMDRALDKFHKKIAKTSYASKFSTHENVLCLVNLYDKYKSERMNTPGAVGAMGINLKYQQKSPEYFVFLKPGRNGEAKIINRALRKLSGKRKVLRRKMRKERVQSSFFGMLGRALEPITRFAGFDWKTNVALISSFAARESAVATLGVLYQDGADENLKLEGRIRRETAKKQGEQEKPQGRYALHALALIIFFALYPPCLATIIMIRVQTGSYKWMLFSILFPSALGLAVASAVFTIGTTFALSGVVMMKGFYLFVVMVAVLIAVVHKWKSD